MKQLYVWGLCLFCTMSFFACTPQEEVFTNSQVTLGFSDQAVVFDTLFTNTRSITKRLTVYNPDKNAVKIQRIEVGGKSASPYQVTIKGRKDIVFTDIDLLGGDSLLVLVEINVPSDNQSGVAIAFDSLLFTTNQLEQQIKLIAWRENARVLQNYTITGNETWDKTQPYIIQDSVTVAPGATLTIEDSTRVFAFNQNAFLKVQGNLVVRGDTGKVVSFGGFRREIEFEEQLGQWRGIVMEAGSTADISFAVIKNAITGIAIAGNDADATPDLTLKNTLIKNMLLDGIKADNADALLENVIITNCIGNTLGVINGGNYTLQHCTLANYEFEFIRTVPSISLSNEANNAFAIDWVNNILWGNKTEEIALPEPLGNLQINARFNILRTTLTVFEGNNNLLNEDPLFERESISNLNLMMDSPAINAASPIGILIDFRKITRDATPDIGALEFVPE
ncbi:hypothetical protein BKI52_27390 [marine bacterium AO1-C]|nr:hypothetical protein BKI52_27390 [marine bacterium AO1-C]